MQRSVVLVVLACFLAMADLARAERWYGNLNLLLERSRQDGLLKFTDNTSQQSLQLNYEDALFVKNQMRLSAHLNRREYPNSTQRDFRPVFYIDLKSLGYNINVSYSPFRRLSAGAQGAPNYYIYYRDWRTSVNLNYDRYPPVNFTYNRSRTFDKEPVRRFDSKGNTYVFDTRHTLGDLSMRAGFGRIQQISGLERGLDSKTDSYSGALTYSGDVRRVGNFSSVYSYYSSSSTRVSPRFESRTSFAAHTLTSLVTSERYAYTAATVSYSGRWAKSKSTGIDDVNDNHTVSGQLSFQPTSYLGFDATKAYQTIDETGPRQVVEYVSLSGNFTRYLRQGVDTRVGVTRTIFQRSNKYLFSPGREDDRGQYNSDSYYASLSLVPINYVRTYWNLSLSRDSDPIIPSQKYQVFRSLNSQFQITGRLEGRFGIVAIYQGEELRFNESISRNYSFGFSYVPTGNLNLSLNYIATSTFGAAELKTGALSGYVSYAFRKAFTVYVNATNQKQETLALPGSSSLIEDMVVKPHSVSAQLLIYLTPKVTLTGGYLYSMTESGQGTYSLAESFQAILNFQI